MVTNDAERGQTVAQLERIYQAVAALRREVYHVNPHQLARLAEIPEVEIRCLQAAIDFDTGRDELARLFVPA